MKVFQKFWSTVLFKNVAALKLIVDSVDQEQLTKNDRHDHHLLNGPLGFSLGLTRKHAHTLRWAGAKTFLEWRFGASELAGLGVKCVSLG
jgi:hypothetical protein